MKLRHRFYTEGDYPCIAYYLSEWEMGRPVFATEKTGRSDGIYSEIVVPQQFAILMDVKWVKVESGELACYRFIGGAKDVLFDLVGHIPQEELRAMEAEIDMVQL